MTGTITVFNNLVRIWKILVLLLLYTLVIANAQRLFQKKSVQASRLRGQNFFDPESEISWRDFWPTFSTFQRSHL